MSVVSNSFTSFSDFFSTLMNIIAFVSNTILTFALSNALFTFINLFRRTPLLMSLVLNYSNWYFVPNSFFRYWRFYILWFHFDVRWFFFKLQFIFIDDFNFRFRVLFYLCLYHFSVRNEMELWLRVLAPIGLGLFIWCLLFIIK